VEGVPVRAGLAGRTHRLDLEPILRRVAAPKNLVRHGFVASEARTAEHTVEHDRACRSCLAVEGHNWVPLVGSMSSKDYEVVVEAHFVLAEHRWVGRQRMHPSVVVE